MTKIRNTLLTLLSTLLLTSCVQYHTEVPKENYNNVRKEAYQRGYFNGQKDSNEKYLKLLEDNLKTTAYNKGFRDGEKNHSQNPEKIYLDDNIYVNELLIKTLGLTPIDLAREFEYVKLINTNNKIKDTNTSIIGNREELDKRYSNFFCINEINSFNNPNNGLPGWLEEGKCKGNGIQISPHLILTSNHVVKNPLSTSSSLHITSPTMPYKSEVYRLAVSNIYDLCILYSKEELEPPQELRIIYPKKLKQNQLLQSMGIISYTPSGEMIRYSSAGSYKWINEGINFGSDNTIVQNEIITTQFARGGYSGSPVFTNNGNLVGLIWATSDKYSYLTPAYPIFNMFDEIINSFK